MSDTTPPADTGRSRMLFFLLSCLLIGNFVYCVLVPAHEYGAPAEEMLTVGLNLLMVIGLFGIRAQGPEPLFWTAVVAGVGLLLIRFTGDSAWWTGHLMYSLSPR